MSILCLFVFQALDRIPLVRAIINLIVEFMRDRVVQWILDRGGWVSPPETYDYFFYYFYVTVRRQFQIQGKKYMSRINALHPNTCNMISGLLCIAQK